jgi:apolipoprotein D and lipocalin family protein
MDATPSPVQSLAKHVLRHRGLVAAATCLAALAWAPPGAVAQNATTSTPPQASATAVLPKLDVSGYMGRWYQLALYPNRFQAQCVSDSSATYRLLPNNNIEVKNVCTTASGRDEVLGIARPRGSKLESGQLSPASLEVSFVPQALRWLGVGWGAYDVVMLLNQGALPNQIALVSEPSREYLWVLSRSPSVDAATWTQVEAALRQGGFDMSRVVREKHQASATKSQ